MTDNPGHIVLPNDDIDSYAIQALFKGEASPDQQIRAMTCIVNELCGTYDQTFDPESVRWSDFNSGKRHIGRTLVNIATVNIGLIKETTKQIDAARNPTPVKIKRKGDR